MVQLFLNKLSNLKILQSTHAHTLNHTLRTRLYQNREKVAKTQSSRRVLTRRKNLQLVFPMQTLTLSN